MLMKRSGQGVAPETTQILDDLRRVVRVLRESSRTAQSRIGLSGAQLFVLQSLADRDALSFGALAARTRTHQSTVSVVVKRLVERGLVTRATSADDGRRVALSLTAKGRGLLRKAPRAAQDRLIEGIEGLPVRHRLTLQISLHRLVESMHIGGDLPAMFFEEEERRRGRS